GRDQIRKLRRVLLVSLVDDSPYPSAVAIPTRVIQRNFVMADDPVVKIGDIQGAVGTQLQIDGPTPGIVANEEVGLFNRLIRRAMRLQDVRIDPRGNRVADEYPTLVFSGKVIGVVINNARDAGRAVA